MYTYYSKAEKKKTGLQNRARKKREGIVKKKTPDYIFPSLAVKMRLKLTDVPFWSLLFLPLFVGYNGYGIFSALLLLLVWALVRQVIVVADVKR